MSFCSNMILDGRHMSSTVVIGGGISGLTAAVRIAEESYGDVILVEAGKPFEMRGAEGRDVVEGLGGAGTTAGGKWCYPPASSGAWAFGGFSKRSFEKFCCRYGIPLPHGGAEHDATCSLIASSDIYAKGYESKLLPQKAVAGLIGELAARVKGSGGGIITGAKALRIERCGHFNIKLALQRLGDFWLEADQVVVATGRSSSGFIGDLLSSAIRIIEVSPDLGIRIEMPLRRQGAMTRIGKDFKAKRVHGGTCVRTFCVCAGGESVRVESSGLLYYDGHFPVELTDKVSFGILARSCEFRGFDAAKGYLAEYARLFSGSLSLREFCSKAGTAGADCRFAPIYTAISDFAKELCRIGALGASLDECTVVGPSVDRLNPCIPTDEDCMTDVEGLYVVGDAKGVARGYLQSMWLGDVAGRAVAERLAMEEQVAIAV